MFQLSTGCHISFVGDHIFIPICSNESFANIYWMQIRFSHVSVLVAISPKVLIHPRFIEIRMCGVKTLDGPAAGVSLSLGISLSAVLSRCYRTIDRRRINEVRHLWHSTAQHSVLCGTVRSACRLVALAV